MTQNPILRWNALDKQDLLYRKAITSLRSSNRKERIALRPAYIKARADLTIEHSQKFNIINKANNLAIDKIYSQYPMSPTERTP